jgi:hypothetical protein
VLSSCTRRTCWPHHNPWRRRSSSAVGLASRSNSSEVNKVRIQG